MELIAEDLIKESAIDDIRPLGNRINNYINRIVTDSCRVQRETCRFDLRFLSKGPCTRLEDFIFLLFQLDEVKINVAQ